MHIFNILILLFPFIQTDRITSYWLCPHIVGVTNICVKNTTQLVKIYEWVKTSKQSNNLCIEIVLFIEFITWTEIYYNKFNGKLKPSTLLRSELSFRLAQITTINVFLYPPIWLNVWVHFQILRNKFNHEIMYLHGQWIMPSLCTRRRRIHKNTPFFTISLCE